VRVEERGNPDPQWQQRGDGSREVTTTAIQTHDQQRRILIRVLGEESEFGGRGK